MREEELRRERRDGDTASNYSTSTVGRQMQRLSNGISPPQRMRGQSNEDVSKRPSRLAASIAASLDGNANGEVVLGSAGRRVQEKRRSVAREKSAKHLRNSKSKGEIRLSTVEMDTMFDQITTKLTTDLDEHTKKLDSLDKKSKQFDRHMDDLRKANKEEMEVRCRGDIRSSVLT